MRCISLLHIVEQTLLAISSGVDRNGIADSKVECLVSIFDTLLHNTKPDESITRIRVDGFMDGDMKVFENKIQNTVACQHLKSALSYFVSELVCNVEQHAGVEAGYGLSLYDSDENSLIVGIADGGVSIYGSYVKSQKYLAEVGDSDSQALYLAQNGYSTKNRPDAENRGYGISSNIKMIVDGLDGTFAIISGNALFYCSSENKKIYTLPDDVIWPGTLVLAEIPVKEKEFNIYNYIG